MSSARGLAVVVTAAAALLLAGCASSDDETDASGDTSRSAGGGSGDTFPVTVEHAYGTTTVPEKPERIATVAWANHEVPLALGVVPVGMSRAAWGDDDGDGVLPWVEERLGELDAETPVLFDESDGIDVEAVADTRPDVILAAYSGITREEYDTLSRIAPVVAYPDVAWGTSMDDMIRLDSAAIGMADEGDELVEHLDDVVDESVAAYPQLDDAGVLFGYLDPTDLSRIGFYTTHDTRPAFLETIGMSTPGVVERASSGSEEFYTTTARRRRTSSTTSTCWSPTATPTARR